MLDLLQYDFMIYALIAGLAISVSASLLGVGLVLRKTSLIGDGLSHVAFGAMAIGLALGTQPLIFSLIVVVFSAFLILKLSQSSNISGDAIIAVLSTTSLALGMVVLNRFNIQSDLNSALFGSLLGLDLQEVILSVVVALIVLIAYTLMYQRLFVMIFDEPFAKTSGLNTDLYQTMIALLTALTIVVGMRLMGALLVSGLIVFPVLSAMRLTRSFKAVTISAVIISVLSMIVGLSASVQFNTPTGASIILVNALVFALSLIYSGIVKTTHKKENL